jgi:hypothetical protein
MLMTGAALAGVSAVMAYSGVSTDRYTLPTDRNDGQQDTPAMEESDSTMASGLAGPSAMTRPRIAGAAGAALAVLGVGMMIRRRRRAAGSGEEV